MPPASGSPAAAGVRSRDGSQWQKPGLLLPPPPAPRPASLALPQASSQNTLPGARLGGLRAQWSEPSLKRPKSQLPAQLSLFLAV